MRTNAEFERDAMNALLARHGRTLLSVSAELGMSAPKANRVPKALGALVVGRILDASPLRVDRLQLERRGIRVKTVRMPPGGTPYESMSFPAFSHDELGSETWESSALGNQLRRLLIVPLHAPQRSTALAAATIAMPLFWSPSAEEVAVIQREWQMFRDRIRRGAARDLPSESETRAIHVRPHGRNARDTDSAPLTGGGITRKSFWLNRAFVEGVIRSAKHQANQPADG